MDWPVIILLIVIGLLCYGVAAMVLGRTIRHGQLPGCYGSNPGPQDRAENDCIHCEWNDLCLRGPARFTKEELDRK